MSTENTPDRQSPDDPTALPRLLASRKGALLAAWRRSVLDDPNGSEAKHGAEPRLLDDMAEFVDEMVEELMRAVTRRDVAARTAPHARARRPTTSRSSLVDTLREWTLFRSAVIDLFDQHRLTPSGLQLKLVHGAIDGAMTDAAIEMQDLALETVEDSLAEERRLSTKLREEGDLREQFVALLGHDLRNPLSAIEMGATKLLHRIAARPPEDVLRRIASSAARMARMIDDLLDVTRMRLGVGLDLATEAVDLGDLCKRILGEFEMSDPDRTITIDCSPSVVGMWDQGRLSRAVSNLVKNALVHGDATSPVSLGIRDVDGVAEITVTNHGREIPAEVRPSLFRPFSRGGHSDGGRLGLGLYIVRQVALAHGGEVFFTSEHGKTAFTLRLPKQASVTTS